MKPNPAADRVRTWDRLWGAFIHARQIGDAALLADAQRAIQDFDQQHNQRTIVCTKGA